MKQSRTHLKCMHTQNTKSEKKTWQSVWSLRIWIYHPRFFFAPRFFHSRTHAQNYCNRTSPNPFSACIHNIFFFNSYSFLLCAFDCTKMLSMASEIEILNPFEKRLTSFFCCCCTFFIQNHIRCVANDWCCRCIRLPDRREGIESIARKKCVGSFFYCI